MKCDECYFSGSKKQPIMINVIREPIEHIVSIFKLSKYGDRIYQGQEVDSFGDCNFVSRPPLGSK